MMELNSPRFGTNPNVLWPVRCSPYPFHVQQTQQTSSIRQSCQGWAGSEPRTIRVQAEEHREILEPQWQAQSCFGPGPHVTRRQHHQTRPRGGGKVSCTFLLCVLIEGKLGLIHAAFIWNKDYSCVDVYVPAREYSCDGFCLGERSGQLGYSWKTGRGFRRASSRTETLARGVESLLVWNR